MGQNRHREIKIKDWNALLSFYQKHFAQAERGHGRGWVFRGEKSSKYRLETSLERAVKSFGHDLKEARTYENKLLQEFKRRLHYYVADIPHRFDFVEWLALMQHYGAPTRLLDWTYSFFIAVYFAVEAAHKKHGDSVVWGNKDGAIRI